MADSQRLPHRRLVGPLAVTFMREEELTNVGQMLSETARRDPEGLAVAMPLDYGSAGDRRYQTISFAELDRESDCLAAGLVKLGAKPGHRIALMVPQSIDFITWVFALFKAGVVQVLIDPGMGRRNMIDCLADVSPDGIVGITKAHLARRILKRRFPKARLNVTVGKRRFGSLATSRELHDQPFARTDLPTTQLDDPAAIIFTTGSTGPPKGVLYRHRNFIRQATEIRDFYKIEPGEVDLPGFPLFALFNCAMGTTTILPDMDPTRPAQVDPELILEAINDWPVTQMFGSPAMLNTVSRYCEAKGRPLTGIRRVLSAGAPVPPHVLLRVKNLIEPGGEIYTPYGATEALPVASQSASEVLSSTAAESEQGAGTCVGKRFPGIQWQVIEIDDGPIESIDDASPCEPGTIGELMVRGPVVTREYVTQVDANSLHKVKDGDAVWHRMGDVGYLDDQERFWFCGRKSHRVRTADGTLYTIPCEAFFNHHPHVYRSALIGLGKTGAETPVIVCEPWPEHWSNDRAVQQRLIDQLREIAGDHEMTRGIKYVLLRRNLPVDIRHNAKIFREQLRPWAAKRVRL